jgi:ABC-2 type transport system ATP-binding protein
MLVKYDDIVSFAELEKFMDQKLKNYSSGMQVRLAFSIAIRAETDILLLDEVLAVGDAAFQQKCYDYFENLKEEKKTVVFVSHSMDAVRRFCTDAVYIDAGKLVYKGSPTEIADMYLEENMERSQKSADKAKDKVYSNRHSLSAKISERTADGVTVTFSYSAEESDELYLGISVIKDGISIAEMNTMEAKPLSGKGKAVYRLDTRPFNGGVYHIGGGLFRRKNREVLAASKKAEFIVKGNDDTRGASLKLADTWKYK